MSISRFASRLSHSTAVRWTSNASNLTKEVIVRKIVAGLFLSLDGVYEAPDQWHFPYFNDEMGAAVGGQMQNSDTMLLGRVTYEEFAGYWPDHADDPDIGAFMNDTPKLVVSNTLTSLDWKNSTLVAGDVAGQLTAIKAQPGK